HRGIWENGWKAVTRHLAGVPFDDDQWELYHVDVDRSECHDLAADEPERLAAMVELWWHEAEDHGVLPLDDRTIELFGARFRDGSPHRADRHYTYRPPMSSMPAQVGAQIGGRSWDLDAQIVRATGENGVLYATGTANSGVSVFVQERSWSSTTTSSACTAWWSPTATCPPAHRSSACGSGVPAARVRRPAAPPSSST